MDCNDKIMAYFAKFFSPKQEKDFAQHLNTCETCRKTVEELKNAHAVLQNRQRPRPSDAWMADFERDMAKRFPTHSTSPRKRRFSTFFQPHPAPTWQWARAVALVLFGVILGRLFFTSSAPQPTSMPYAIETVELSRNDIQAVANFLTQTEFLLLEIENHQDAALILNWSLHRDMATALLNQKKQVNRTAKQWNGRLMEIYLDRLEVLLLDVANRKPEEIKALFQDVRTLVKDTNMIQTNRQLQQQIEQALADFV